MGHNIDMRITFNQVGFHDQAVKKVSTPITLSSKLELGVPKPPTPGTSGEPPSIRDDEYDGGRFI